MVKRIIFLLALPLAVFGGNLSLTNGLIQAHTKVFGDASINPSVKNIQADVSMQNNAVESLKGILSFPIIDFKSSERDRDEHMQEMFAMKTYPNITLQINKVRAKNKHYMIEGVLNMHGIEKPIDINSSIVQNGDSVAINANFSVNVSDYGMEPPSLLFFTVRDRVDINASITLKTED